MAFNIDELVAMKRLDDVQAGHQQTTDWQVYETVNGPQAMPGNVAGSAYGGCISSMCLAAAYQSCKAASVGQMNVYSCFGNFLGPCFVKFRVRLYVESLRDTRSFATRFVRAAQRLDDGSERTCMTVTVDFYHVLDHSRTVFNYSDQPSLPQHIVHHSKLQTLQEQFTSVLKDRKDELTTNELNALQRGLKTWNNGSLIKLSPGGILHDSTYFQLRDACQTLDAQQHLSLTQKRSYDWLTARTIPTSGHDSKNQILYPPTQTAANACWIMLAIDGWMSFLPFIFQPPFKRWQDALQVNASLDFALRFHSHDLDVFSNWLLHEMRTIAADDQRGYDEARLYKENGLDSDGKPKYKLLCTMTQATIVRGKEIKAKSSL